MSPLYSPAIHQSPGYQPVSGQSGVLPNQISPAYRPDVQRQPAYSPYYRQVSPAYDKTVSPGIANKISPAYSPSALVHSPAYSGLAGPSTGGIKPSIYSPNLASSVSPHKPAYASSNVLSPTSDLVKSPYYVPPMSSAVLDKMVSPSYDSVGSDVKQVTSPDYNPASPGYVPSH
jgi:hypothetical protein